MITPEVLEWAQTLWDYHSLHHSLHKADCILALGSQDTRVASRAAGLYLEGWAPLLIFSGGFGRLTTGESGQPEAEKFAEIAMGMGVPAEHILIERKSANTGENISFTKELLEKKGIVVNTLILVQKPYMERRTYATFQKVWPGKEVYITSPDLSFEDYPTAQLPLGHVINIMTGDLQRIKMYPAKGFQIHQDIPDVVWDAYLKLVKAGFHQQLIR